MVMTNLSAVCKSMPLGVVCRCVQARIIQGMWKLVRLECKGPQGTCVRASFSHSCRLLLQREKHTGCES
eukprot:5852993-Amphidinium_carterae.1